jgi:hypothetical protein
MKKFKKKCFIFSNEVIRSESGDFKKLDQFTKNDEKTEFEKEIFQNVFWGRI